MLRKRDWYKRLRTNAPAVVDVLTSQDAVSSDARKGLGFVPDYQPLTAWVHAIAKYKLVDLMRRRQSRDLLTDPFDHDNDLFSSADPEAAEARRDVIKLLDQLPERQRLPIFYTKLQGLSVVETARITGMTASAVKIGVHRGLKALAASIRGDR